MNDGDWMRDGHEQQERRGQRLSSAAPNTESASHSSSPGILVFSHRRQLLHMNCRPLELTGHLERAETGPATMTISRLVSQLRIQIQDILDSRVEANVWEFFECKRVMVESERKVLLRGFGLPNRHSREHSRVIIILEEVSLQQKRGAAQSQARVHSPDREGAAWEHVPREKPQMKRFSTVGPELCFPLCMIPM